MMKMKKKMMTSSERDVDVMMSTHLLLFNPRKVMGMMGMMRR